jgi:hypothetical protein
MTPQYSQAVVTELKDDPPFHKIAVGTVLLEGGTKYFAVNFNPNNVATVNAIEEPFRSAVQSYLKKS